MVGDDPADIMGDGEEVPNLKGFQIKSRAGRFTWLQVLALALSAVGYLTQNVVLMLVMVVLASVFGILAMTARIQEAKTIARQPPRPRRRK